MSYAATARGNVFPRLGGTRPKKRNPALRQRGESSPTRVYGGRESSLVFTDACLSPEVDGTR